MKARLSPSTAIAGLLAWVAAVVVVSVLWFTAHQHEHSAQQLQLKQAQTASGAGTLRGLGRGGVPAHLGSFPSQNGVPAYTVRRIAHPDSVDWPGGGFVELDVQHSIPPSASHEFDNRSISCYDFARKAPLPYTGLYKRRHAPPQDLPGGAPRTFFRWDGVITRAEFDAVPSDLPRGPLCTHCGPAVRYQVVDKHLYRLGEEAPNGNWLVKEGEDLLLVALHLWDLPDMDFIIHYDDSCPPNVPVLSWNICRDRPKGGFAFPSYTAWMYALGVEQLKVYHQCLISRYPAETRRPVVFWRGSNTDPWIGSTTIENMDKVTRITMHKRFLTDPVVDAKLSKLILAERDDCVERYVQPLAPMAQLEDYNAAAIIMDVDGNGWSDRLSRVVHFPSATFKQASNHTAFFEHLLAPGQAVEYFANDLSDLKERAYRLVAEWNVSTSRLMKLAAQKQGIGLTFLNQVAVAEAAAYALLQYSKKTSWTFVRNSTYTHVPFSKSCGGQGSDGATLPAELCAEMRARPPHQLTGGLGTAAADKAGARRLRA